jgi:hypothetical protein
MEGVETISGLITRYTIIEMLYIHEAHEASEATTHLHESIIKLYVAILLYLAQAKAYFDGNTISTY